MIYDLIMEMVEYYSGDPHQIQHFIKVHSYSKLIGTKENVSPELMEILEAAAVVHDIGIKPSMEKFGRADGSLQEQEGPAVAEEMLKNLDFSESVTARVCYLVAHHHTYTKIDGLDYQILVEADFLVNLHEAKQSRESAEAVYKNIFRTETGKSLCRQMFLV
jgi:HD superfamily phosphodiesterase